MIGILATWRLTNLLTDPDEEGPYELLSRFRDAIGIRYDEHSRPYAKNEVGKAFTCFWCASFWVGLVIAKGNPVKALAYSGGAILIREWLRWHEQT